MRPLLITDLIAAARVVAAVPDEDRAALARRLFREAGMADRHRLRTGRNHPECGNGSLMAAAMRHPKRHDCEGMDQDFLRAFACLVGIILEEMPQGARQFPFVSRRGTLCLHKACSQGVRNHGGNPGEGIVD